MLIEFTKVGQPGPGHRRYFIDNENQLDLYIWYDKKGGKITGFQLTYNLFNDPHCLTWRDNKGYAHNKIDDGDMVGARKRAAILVADGHFNTKVIAGIFHKQSKKMKQKLRQFIFDKIIDYDTIFFPQ